MWWPLWIALTSAGLAVTWFTDRTAFVGFLAVLCGLVAMQIPFGIPRFFPALTIWAIVAAVIVISSNSILAGFVAVLVALAYLPAAFGMPWLHAAFWSDVAGVCLLAALILPTGLALVGHDRDWPRLVDSRPLPAWPREAVAALVSAQASAPTEAVEREW